MVNRLKYIYKSIIKLFILIDKIIILNAINDIMDIIMVIINDLLYEKIYSNKIFNSLLPSNGIIGIKLNITNKVLYLINS